MTAESVAIIGANRSRNIAAVQDPPGDALVSYSPRDKPWDTHRAQADAVSSVYARAQEFEGYARRMGLCSGTLLFAHAADPESGEITLRLREARFCRVRHCPVCQWRRSLMWLARLYQALPAIEAQHPRARWIFLTLTVRNCEITELRATLRDMNAGWNRLRLRSEFRAVQGWIRGTEVTRGKRGDAHPHFHCLLMVPPAYFGRQYVTQNRWSELWRECMRLDYTPVVDVRVVRAKPGTAAGGDALRAAAAEVLKYAVKPADLVVDGEWLLEMTRQVHKLRFIASGGALKNVLRVEDETDADLALVDDDAEGETSRARLAFAWRKRDGHYRRDPARDVSDDD
jgi:plasmid rolling circle replication initiator protein Rep